MAKVEVCVFVAVLIFASVLNFSSENEIRKNKNVSSIIKCPGASQVIANKGQALRCYVCSSDLDPYCGDPFNTTLMTSSSWGGLTPHHVLQDCTAQTPPTSYLHQSRTVCKKMRQIINNRETIIRSCSWQSPDTTIGNCPANPVATHIRVDFCETCDMDGCNSATTTGIAKHLLVLVPAVIFAKFVRF